MDSFSVAISAAALKIESAHAPLLFQLMLCTRKRHISGLGCSECDWSNGLPKVSALQIACARGNLKAVQFYLSRVSAADVRARNCAALGESCGAGRLEIAKLLADTYALTASDARSDDNAALGLALAFDEFDVAQWLVERFGLDADDARAVMAQDRFGDMSPKAMAWIQALRPRLAT